MQQLEQQATQPMVMLNALSATFPDMLWTYGQFWHQVAASAALLELVGWSAAEIRRHTFLYFIHPDDRQTVLTALRQPRQTGVAWEVDARIRCHDGRYIWLAWSIYRCVESSGLYAFARDITLRKQAEARFAAIFETAAVPITLIGTDGRFLAANRHWQNSLGYRAEEISGLSYLDVTSEANREAARQAVEGILSGQHQNVRMEKGFLRKNGTVFWGEIFISPIIDAAGQVEAAIGLICDITDRREEALCRQMSEQRLRDFARATKELSFIIDEGGRYVDIFNWPAYACPENPQCLIGQRLDDSLTEGMSVNLLERMHTALRDNSMQEFEFEINTKQGKRLMECHLAPMRDWLNGKRLAAVVATDITEKRLNERLLRQAYERRRRNDLMQAILNGHWLGREDLQRQLLRIGFDVPMPFQAFMLQVSQGMGKCERQQEPEAQAMWDALIDHFNEEPGQLAWDHGDGIGIIRKAVISDGGRGEAVQQEVKAFLGTARQYLPQLTLAAGISLPHAALTSIRKACREAFDAVAIGSCLGERSWYYYDDIGVMQLFKPGMDQMSRHEYIQRRLGPLLAYDAEKGSNFIETLEALLQEGSLKKVAERMFLHPKTVVFRKQRIEQMLEVSLDDFETCLELGMALKLLRLENGVFEGA